MSSDRPACAAPKRTLHTTPATSKAARATTAREGCRVNRHLNSPSIDSPNATAITMIWKVDRKPGLAFSCNRLNRLPADKENLPLSQRYLTPLLTDCTAER